MWLAIIIACYTPAAESCIIIANSKQLSLTQEACIKNIQSNIPTLRSRFPYSTGGCTEIGQGV